MNEAESEPVPVPGLTTAGCRDRQHVLREYLRSRKIDAALITDPRHVHYFTGYWGRQIFQPVLLVEREGESLLSLPLPVEQELAADVVVQYESNHLGTIVDDQLGAALAALPRLPGPEVSTGLDCGLRPGLFPAEGTVDLLPVLTEMRRCKDADELDLLNYIIDVTEFCYDYAKEQLEPGLSEVELFAAIQGTAADEVGEALGEPGNDFQIGTPGGPPRRREAEAGEMAILDLTLVVRGYRSDMCRSYVVGGEPSELQLEAWSRVMEVLERIEMLIEPGIPCRELYEEAVSLLTHERGWTFPHHLGHGIGLGQHEAPRLNPHWDDTLQIGDVFTLEPGLYHPELKAGVRIEQVYHLGEHGVDLLTGCPTELN